MIRRPPRSTRTDHSFPTRRSSDLPVHADIRRDGPVADLVAQPEAELDVGDALALADLPVVRRGQVDLADRLQDQPVGEQEVVLDAEARRQVALLAEEQVNVELVPLRHQTIEAEDAIYPVRTGRGVQVTAGHGLQGS